MTLSSAGLEVLVPDGEELLPGDTTNIPIRLEAQTSPGHCGLLIPLSQQAKKDITMLRGATDPDYQGEIGFLLPSGGRQIMSEV